MIPGPNVIKTFLRIFVIVIGPGKLFQPSLMFVGKTRIYPSEVPFQVKHSRVGSWPYPQILE
jgi:hypothetical protein